MRSRRLIVLLIVIAIFLMTYRGLDNVDIFKSSKWLEFQTYVVDSGHIETKRQNLPNLKKIRWPEREYLPAPMGAPGSRQLPLDAKFSRAQMHTLWSLFSSFITAMEELGFSDRAMMRRFQPDILVMGLGPRDKIYARLIEPRNSPEDVYGSRKLSAYNWGWPYIDISYYSTNLTHVHVLAPSYLRYDTYAKSDVFPLLLRPFNKFWVPTPRNTFAVLLQSFPGKEDCYTQLYSHIFENGTEGVMLPCRNLAKRYAFVEHVPLHHSIQSKNGSQADLDWVRERLLRDGKVIHELQLVAPRRESNVETYSLQAKSNI
ncbi:unnamed protein product [Dibothriocephalus latus]|uniref:Uncharacterized protein n=1 Tax=Dibothriocephalus latus TaxID=60516 RepID=A0A3P7NFR2_DIBLA|nr:unnamed protein product [Dibothriocephalus latus]